MGTKLFYKPGSYYQIDDITGFAERADKMKREWTGMMTRPQSWEARNAQDFVKGVRDDQTVPIPRPRQSNVWVQQICYWDLPSVFWDENNNTSSVSQPDSPVYWDIGFGGPVEPV